MTTDQHTQDLDKLPLTDREREICREALGQARAQGSMGPYCAMVGVMQSMSARHFQQVTRCVCDECYAEFDAALPPDGSDAWDAIRCPKCGTSEFGWSDETGDE